MSNSYNLEIISQHPDFKNKNLRKYNVEDIETIGVWKDEPFEILFKNNTSNKVQVKFSIDGTDIFTGKLATTEVTEKMWLVNAYDKLSIKAWPESNNGGAQLVFTNVNNSVAVHTHGNLSSRGIIAVAVFIEGQVNTYPAYKYHYTPYYIPWNGFDYHYNKPYFGHEYEITCNANIYSTNISTEPKFETISKEQQNLVAVGAGGYIAQKITYVAGLVKPTFTESIRVRYLWWDSLMEKLRFNSRTEIHGSGFPADKNNIDLKNTPRIDNYIPNFEEEFNFSRI